MNKISQLETRIMVAILGLLLLGVVIAFSFPAPAQIDINTQTKGTLLPLRGGSVPHGASISLPKPKLTDDGVAKHLFWSNEKLQEIRCWTDSGEVDVNFELRPADDPGTATAAILAAPLACTSTAPMNGTTAFLTSDVATTQPFVVRITNVTGSPAVLNVFIKSNPR